MTLGLGVFVGVVQSRATSASFAAAGVATLFAVGTSMAPDAALRRPLIRETVLLAGAILSMTAVSLSGGSDSPYLLFSLVPTIYANSFGGFRLGMATALLSAGLFGAIALVDSPTRPTLAMGWAGLYVVVGLTFAQTRRLLVEINRSADALAEQSSVVAQRLLQLEDAHDLLTRLSEISDTADINPINIASSALESLAETLPDSAALAAMTSDRGPVVVWRQGKEQSPAFHTRFPLVVNDVEVGFVEVSTPGPLADQQRQTAEDGLRPLALAFSNILLLQGIARKAIREERTRMARELHDELGPSLASLGLALDLVTLQHPTEPDLVSHLQDLRGNVSQLVEEVRASVADLRDPSTPSLSQTLAELDGSLTEPPVLEIRLRELRPPRPAIAGDVGAIVVEAIRNAHRHSGGQKVLVEGIADFDRGRITVADDGTGFDPAATPDRRFGLVGMKERADRIGAKFSIESNQAGTSVTLSWGSQ
jgi:signal transduction histidine kinase